MPANTPDAYSPLVCRITFVPVDGPPKSIPAHEYLQSIEVEQTAYGAWVMHLTLFDQGGEGIEDFLLAYGAQNELVVQVQWGWDRGGSDNGLASVPVWASTVMFTALRVTAQGTAITLTLMTKDLGILASARPTLSWAAGARFSDIFKQIASDQNWNTNASSPDGTAYDGVQTSANGIPDGLSMAGESPVGFINRYLCPYALDSQGRGGFRCFFDQPGAVHFCNHYYAPLTTSATYRFARDSMGEVISFEPRDLSLLAALMGSGNSQYTSASSEQGATADTATSFSRGAAPGATPTQIRDGGYRRDLGDGITSRIHHGERFPDLAEARLRSQYETISGITYEATMTVRGTHAVDLFDYISVEYLRRDGQRHYLSGTFHVLKVNHTVGLQGWSTSFYLRRTAANKAPGLEPVTPGITLSPQVSPGTQQTGKVPANAGLLGGTTTLPVSK